MRKMSNLFAQDLFTGRDLDGDEALDDDWLGCPNVYVVVEPAERSPAAIG